MSKILVLDSGAGGLTIAKNIKALVNCDITFVADQAYFPYGDRDPATLLFLVISLIQQSKTVLPAPDLIVLACNTASTQAHVLTGLRAQLSIPIVGVVPAIKPAGQLSKTGVVGVLATPNTVKSAYLEQLKATHVPHIVMLSQGSIELVSMAEAALWKGVKPSHAALLAVLKPLFAQPQAHLMDVLVLACTHFPLLRPALQQAVDALASRPVTLLDSGAAVARQVRRLMHAKVSTANNKVSTANNEIKVFIRVSENEPLKPKIGFQLKAID